MTAGYEERGQVLADGRTGWGTWRPSPVQVVRAGATLTCLAVAGGTFAGLVPGKAALVHQTVDVFCDRHLPAGSFSSVVRRDDPDGSAG